MDKDPIIEALLKRAADAGLKIDERSVEEPDGTATVYYYVLMPCGNEQRRIYIGSEQRAEDILKTKFDKISFLSDYEAVVDITEGVIEAALGARDQMPSSVFERQLGFRYGDIGSTADGEGSETQSLSCDGPDGIRLEISQCSDDLHILTSRSTLARKQISLKIFNLKELTYAKALSLLETVSNSLFSNGDGSWSYSFSTQDTQKGSPATPAGIWWIDALNTAVSSI